MRKISAIVFTMCIMLLITAGLNAQEDLTAREIVDRADQNMEGESSVSTMSMSIIRPTWERTLEFKNWVLGSDYALTLVTAPSKEKGQTFLKRGNDMWNYLPKIGRLIKLPPSMMSQGWMGSDYTNDDILKESSLVEDYDHRIVAEEEIEGRKCYKIEMIPHEESTIVWGKLVSWISKEDFLFLRNEYYDEDGYLVRTELGKDIKMMDDRLIPTVLEIIPEENPDHKTVVNIKTIDFNVDLNESFFSQQNMKTIR
jgi:outer membrane lipoprotein-sorting protein